MPSRIAIGNDGNHPVSSQIHCQVIVYCQVHWQVIVYCQVHCQVIRILNDTTNIFSRCKFFPWTKLKFMPIQFTSLVGF